MLRRFVRGQVPTFTIDDPQYDVLVPAVFAHHQRRAHEDLALPLLGIAAGRAQSGTSLGTISNDLSDLSSYLSANYNVLIP